jgi:hypothetical protein
VDKTLSPLLAKDPQPSLLLAADARPLATNPALQALLQEGPPLAAWLPANCAALVRACLRQHRAIADVEVQVGERIVLWTFIPDDQGQQVLGPAVTPAPNARVPAKPAAPGACTV